MTHVTWSGVLAGLLGAAVPVVTLAVVPNMGAEPPAVGPPSETAWSGAASPAASSDTRPRPPSTGQGSPSVTRPRSGAGKGSTAASSADTSHDRERSRWAWPLHPVPRLVHPFDPPAQPYGPGHRGVDLASRTGQAVTAVDAGRVVHVGQVAGRGTVTVVHALGLRSTYEPVRASVEVGDVVARGDPLGRVEEVTGHCSPSSCLHLGALTSGGYLDPMLLLTASPIVLLPPR